eukprot:9467534-Pyramimonas_sp.AAC.1
MVSVDVTGVSVDVMGVSVDVRAGRRHTSGDIMVSVDVTGISVDVRAGRRTSGDIMVRGHERGRNATAV